MYECKTIIDIALGVAVSRASCEADLTHAPSAQFKRSKLAVNP